MTGALYIVGTADLRQVHNFVLKSGLLIIKRRVKKMVSADLKSTLFPG